MGDGLPELYLPEDLPQDFVGGILVDGEIGAAIARLVHPYLDGEVLLLGLGGKNGDILRPGTDPVQFAIAEFEQRHVGVPGD